MTIKRRNGNGQYYGRTLITEDTLDKISYQHCKLLDDPFHSEVLREKKSKSLFEESNINSARLESDLMAGRDGKKYHCGRIPKKMLEKEAKNLGSRVREAWEWGRKNFKGEVTEDLIIGMGQIVDPVSNASGTLRNVSARVDLGLSAISPEKLRSTPDYDGHLDRFLKEINEDRIFYSRETDQSESLSPVEKAVHSHFMIFYLQPLMDGNKRTARLVENLILDENSLPPPIIYTPENDEYTNKLVKAFEARRKRDGNPLPNSLISREEHNFYEYLGKKVLISLEKLNDKLDSKKMFYVTLSSRENDKPRYMAAKNALSSLVRHRDSSGHARYKVGRLQDYIEVRGNVNLEDLEAVMDSLGHVKAYFIGPTSPDKR